MFNTEAMTTAYIPKRIAQNINISPNKDTAICNRNRCFDFPIAFNTLLFKWYIKFEKPMAQSIWKNGTEGIHFSE